PVSLRRFPRPGPDYPPSDISLGRKHQKHFPLKERHGQSKSKDSRKKSLFESLKNCSNQYPSKHIRGKTCGLDLPSRRGSWGWFSGEKVPRTRPSRVDQCTRQTSSRPRD
ncbi:hypothetical protein RB213_008195, partial [Colletotrichum asianum]